MEFHKFAQRNFENGRVSIYRQSAGESDSADIDPTNSGNDKSYIIKYGAIRDARFFQWLEQERQALLAKTPEDVSALQAYADRPALGTRATETTTDATPTPAIVLVFAGIVLMAALPPIHRVHVYHRSYHRSDWL